jgi:transposase
MRKNQVYTQEFKEEAIKLALKSPSIGQVAKNLGIPEGTLYGWIDNLKKGPLSHSSNKQSSEQLIEENRRLAKALAIAQEEAAILKKAAAYFARNLK